MPLVAGLGMLIHTKSRRTGKITDTNLQILEGATIAVYKQDTVLVNGTISHAEGLFELKGLLLTLIKG